MPTIPSQAYQDRLVEIAESLKQPLTVTRVTPVATVRVVASKKGFQGWSIEREGDFASLRQRTLRAGDSTILDFGTHHVGQVSLQLGRHGSGDAPTRLKLTFGEVPAEVAEPFDPYNGSLSRAWLQDEVVNVDVVPATVTLPRRYAFRYVKIEVIATSASFAVSVDGAWCDAVSSADRIETAPGTDAIDAPKLKAIDAIALRTLRNCMQTVLEDGPKRDRRLWLGDLRLEALSNSVSFRNFDLIKRCLYLHAGLLREDGFMPACVYETPSPRIGGNFIVDYAALFAPTLLEYVRASGDRAAADELWPVVTCQAEVLEQFFDRDLRFCNPKKMWVFIDWSAKLHKDAAACGVLIFGLRKTMALAQLLGRDQDARRYGARLAQLIAAAKHHYVDAGSGVVVSGPSRQVSYLSQAWMILAGVLTSDDAAAALRRAMSDPDAIKPAGPYGWHYVVEAMCACGMQREARDIVLNYWGAMVDLGADTFWEVFDPADQKLSPYGSHLINSYCHAWSCTPAYFIRKGFDGGEVQR